jgi:ADP-heptose:LPS heptosyltransferase/predicted SAM-dependent methyltransferase
MPWSPNLPQGLESQKIRWEIVQYTRGYGLDLGCGPYKAFPHFIGVDMKRYGPENPDIVMDATDLRIFADESLDFIFSSHLLEDFEDPVPILKEWIRPIKVGGHLVLQLPHRDYYPNVGQPFSNKDHHRDYAPVDLIKLMREIPGWDLMENQNRGDRVEEYSFLQCYRKRDDEQCNLLYGSPKPPKTAAVVRYGGFGDMIQMASILPKLKNQGYHVTVYTTPSGQDILNGNPYIDAWFIQDRDQVPNHLLGPFWDCQKAKYDKWVNLSESVEGTWLAMSGRMNHNWPSGLRKKLLDYNYLEFAHQLAEVAYCPTIDTFFPSQEEIQWAWDQREKMQPNVVLWALAGSSVHKAWPYLDQMIARIMLTYPDTSVVLCGDDLCKALEYGWENEPRVVKASGEWTIRQTLTFAQVSDLVIGPETGILNSVAYHDIPKIITLSHSSVNNLTRDWVKCTSLTPDFCRCYPCHMMHHSFEFCSRDEETGVAECQAKIGAETMWSAITRILRGAKAA